jgi:cell division protein ZapE
MHEPPRRRLQRKVERVPRGLYLVGAPGIGKTHLLAAAFKAAPQPRLFATFDEFLAASGALSMAGLTAHLTANRLLCIDEVDLDDPASIMVLTTLLRTLFDAGTYVIATANARPDAMSGGQYYEGMFTRELGEIAERFEVVELLGEDYRRRATRPESRPAANGREPRVARLRWEELTGLLAETHPMRDVAWLLELDRIALDRLEPLPDSDRTMRFVRFIDRVYDRNVGLSAGVTPAPEEILARFRDQPCFALHYARCRSRLIELLNLSGRREPARHALEQTAE